MCKKCSHSPHSPHSLAQTPGECIRPHSPGPLCNRGRGEWAGEWAGRMRQAMNKRGE